MRRLRGAFTALPEYVRPQRPAVVVDHWRPHQKVRQLVVEQDERESLFSVIFFVKLLPQFF
jgi:hypothetical protein